MRLSAKAEYACLAALELAAAHSSGEPVQTARIAESHGIPWQFLVQIMSQLKNAGLVTSTRGPTGGYRLCRPPHEISLADVLDAIDTSQAPTSSAGKPSALAEALVSCCQAIYDQERDQLESQSLEQLVEKASYADEVMWYI
jgi:Rrf2 family protein